MGCGPTKPKLSSDHLHMIQDIANDTGFTPKVVQHLYLQFENLDKSKNGFLAADDLLDIPALAVNPLFESLIVALHREATTENDIENQIGSCLPIDFHSAQISFPSFVKALARFGPLQSQSGLNPKYCSIEGKLQFLFRMFDLSGTGRVDMKDIINLLRMLVPNVEDDTLEEYAESVFLELSNNREYVTWDDFQQSPILREIAKDMYFRIF